MTAQDAIDYANELIRHNEEVNASYVANQGVVHAAGIASKLLDVATQLKALQDAQKPAEAPSPDAPPAE